MTVKKSIKLLRSRHYKVVGSNNSWQVTHPGSYTKTYTNRELIKLVAMISGVPWSKDIKEDRNYCNRAATKRALNNQDYDSLSPRQLAKDSNVWDYN